MRFGWLLLVALVGCTGASEGAECVISGCSGEVCAEEEVATDCALDCEDLCIADAVCERQPDGACGWTFSDPAAYESCLGDCAGPQ